MNRSPLKRQTPLSRNGWMRRKRPRRLSGPHADPAFLAWVRTRPCCVRFGCEGHIEAHHAGKNPGVGMKAADNTAVPLCRKHHRELTDHSGMFKRSTREELRMIQDNWIGETYALYLAAGSRRGAP